MEYSVWPKMLLASTPRWLEHLMLRLLLLRRLWIVSLTISKQTKEHESLLCEKLDNVMDTYSDELTKAQAKIGCCCWFRE
jgi:hypothetical protein